MNSSAGGGSPPVHGGAVDGATSGWNGAINTKEEKGICTPTKRQPAVLSLLCTTVVPALFSGATSYLCGLSTHTIPSWYHRKRLWLLALSTLLQGMMAVAVLKQWRRASHRTASAGAGPSRPSFLEEGILATVLPFLSALLGFFVGFAFRMDPSNGVRRPVEITILDCAAAQLPYSMMESRAITTLVNAPYQWLLVAMGRLCFTLRSLIIRLSFPVTLITLFEEHDNTLLEKMRSLTAKGYGVERIRVGPCELDTVVIHHRTPGVQRWVLYLGGNGEFMEHSVGRAEPLLERVAAHGIYYNPRGVSNSGGGRVVRLGDLVEDAMAVVRWAMREYGIAAQNVLLLGHSIGGSVAGEVVRHPEFRECALVVDRSFTRLSDAASGMVGAPAGVMRAMYGALRVGDLDTMKGWDAAHDGRKLVIYSTEDRVIRFKCASPGRLAQFCPGGKDEGRSIGLTKDSFRLMDWHNDPLEAFGNAEEVFRRINRLFDSSPSLR